MDTNSLLARKNEMTLYSGTDCVYSHGVRIVLQEKEIDCSIVYTDPLDTCEELAEINPYNETPTLADRDLILYDARIINEYLDERLPHPPLLPVDPVSRARLRLMVNRVDRDWISRLEGLDDDATKDQVRKDIYDGLISISPILAEQDYLLGNDYSLVDVFIAPMLWRLPFYDIKLPKQAKVVEEYAARLFERDSFQESLSEIERDLRLL